MITDRHHFTSLVADFNFRGCSAFPVIDKARESGDSGSGAVFGPFEAEEVGIVPLVSYNRTMGKTTRIIDVKWLPQIDVENPTKGNYVWVKAELVF